LTNEVLDRAAGFATCAILSAAGTSLIRAGAYSLAAGGAGTVPITLGALSLLGAGFACQPMDVGEAEQPGQLNGCGLASPGGYGALQFKSGTQGDWRDWTDRQPFLSITQIDDTIFRYNANKSKYEAICECTDITGQSVTATYEDSSEVACKEAAWRLRIIEGTCDNGSGDLPPIPRDAYDPIPYEDAETGCTYNVQLLGFVEQAPGMTQDPVYVISGSSDSRNQEGGRIGGCNFSPTVYYGGPPGPGGGGGYGSPPFPYIPGDDGKGLPLWLKTLRAALTGAVGALVTDSIIDAIQDALTAPFEGTTYRMVSVCEKDASGEPISQAVEVPIPTLKAPDAQIARLDALVELLQAGKDFKQPICNETVPAEGEFRTIGFISDETSPNGKSCLRKRLRYRSVSGLGLDAVIDHWKDFRFDAGPVIVQHRGASWGSVKCWASSADEGKRVIRHAAGEAGIDADQVGRWEISGSSSSRLGMPGTMKVNQAGGYYWITARDGSDNRPLVGRT